MYKNITNFIIKTTVGFLFSLVVISAMSVETIAAPKQMPDGNLFDAQFYAAAYPDLAAVFGTDEVLLYQHYVISGCIEGRLPYDPSAVAGPMTQEQIYQKLMELKVKYPEGSCAYPELKYTASRFAGYAIQDELFGPDAKLNIYSTGLKEWARNHNVGYRSMDSNIGWSWSPSGYMGQDPVVNAKFEELWSKLQIGDGIRDYKNFMVVLSKKDDRVTVVAGDMFGEVMWEREISKEMLRLSMIRVESYLW